ncbi:MAG: tetratricopeptide repeat protein [Alphaproteobacteria bacterium]|nr:MAG: tetratricopeptide repeat protein [Alphaproteobacteria bacterium]
MPPYDLVNGPREGAAEVFFTVAAAVSGETTNTNALVYARAALHLRPGHVDAALLAADLLEAEGQHDLADAVYSTVPVDHPAYPEAAIGRAEVLMAIERNDDAIELLKSLVASRPNDPDILSALATAYRRLERWAEAEETYSRAIDAKPRIETRDWSLFYARAIARERQGKWEAAEADFRKALELNPDQPSVLNYLGYSLIERGEKLDEALEMIKRAVAGRPDDGYILDSLAWAYFKLGRYDEAVEPMERATELLPSDPILNDHLGDIYWMVGRKREARFQWRRALSFGPEPDEAKRISRKLEVGLDQVLAEEANGG